MFFREIKPEQKRFLENHQLADEHILREVERFVKERELKANQIPKQLNINIPIFVFKSLQIQMLGKEEIKEIVLLGEGHTTEFKVSLPANLKGVAEEV